MSRMHPHVFVLWGQGFEEMPATFFITRLREAGLEVKVVGVSGRYGRGRHGLTLMSDCTVDQALRSVSGAGCVIIPCDGPGIRRMENDPRVSELLAGAKANDALFVIGASAVDDHSPFQSVFPASRLADAALFTDVLLFTYASLDDLPTITNNVVERVME